MLKGYWQAWAISVIIHLVIIYLLVLYTVKPTLPLPKNQKAMNAYVMVNLATLPKPSIKTATSTSFSNKSTSSAKPNNTPSTSKSNVIKTPKKRIETLIDKKQATHFKSNPSSTHNANPLSFKKLNPYAAIPELPVNNLTQNNRRLSNELTDGINANKVITFKPIDLKSTGVISQSYTSNKHIEKYRGKCYLVDTATVFGSNGMPQGTAQPCPGEKTADEVLFKNIMTKWSNKK